jgi:hypothetical protein
MGTKTRYGFGGTTETNSVGTGVWTRRTIARRNDDVMITLTQQTCTHLHLITYQLYKDDTLGWLVLQYNNIIDPIAELVPGLIIAMPHPSRIT